MTDAVELRGVAKHYGGLQALRALDLKIASGQYVVLLGPSGSGKTTLLSILGGFVDPSAGRVLVQGQDVTEMAPAKRPTATVFQDYALFPHMSVGTNVAFGLRMRGQRAAESAAAVMAMLELVGLADLAERRIDQLSGGQRQRIALARALIIEPQVLLLDEPLGALDLHLRRRMQEELHQLQRRIGSVFIHVTHDQEEAMNLADHLVVMRDGAIEDSGPPRRVYLQPATAFTATFMGESNLLSGRVTATEGAWVGVDTPLGPLRCRGAGAVGQAVQVSLRPEHILLAAGETTQSLTRGRVVDLAFQGTRSLLTVQPQGSGNGLLKVSGPADGAPPPGSDIDLFAETERAVLLAT
ncbi:MAG: ABC transporter ATP-binding protein [Rhodospirillales bacterium]